MLEISKTHSISAMDSLHYHEYHEIYVLTTGTQKYIIDGGIYDMQKGDVAIIKKGVFHKTTKGMGGERILVCFDDGFLSEYLTERARPLFLGFSDKKVIRPDERDFKSALALISDADKAIKKGNGDAAFLSLTGFLSILGNSESAGKIQPSENSTVIKAVNYVSENFATVSSLEEVANAVYISKYYLCRLFSEELGLSFNKFLNKVRLRHAEKLLSETKKSVGEIAMECGFSDPAYFCKVFGKQFGVTPAVFKKLSR
ncbi:MAG TPA: hypothetical protein DDW54_00480 [Clostridiales bacterium]|nr:hypothetical protein [Clostridiales bacterium]